jgi:hypothetical protein
MAAMKGGGIELGQHVSYYDHFIVIQISLGGRFMYQVNDVVGPSLGKS